MRSWELVCIYFLQSNELWFFCNYISSATELYCTSTEYYGLMAWSKSLKKFFWLKAKFRTFLYKNISISNFWLLLPLDLIPDRHLYFVTFPAFWLQRHSEFWPNNPSLFEFISVRTAGLERTLGGHIDINLLLGQD